MYKPYLEGILLAIDMSIQISMFIKELSGADITNPGGDIIAAEVMAVMAVH